MSTIEVGVVLIHANRPSCVGKTYKRFDLADLHGQAPALLPVGDRGKQSREVRQLYVQTEDRNIFQLTRGEDGRMVVWDMNKTVEQRRPALAVVDAEASLEMGELSPILSPDSAVRTIVGISDGGLTLFNAETALELSEGAIVSLVDTFDESAGKFGDVAPTVEREVG